MEARVQAQATAEQHVENTASRRRRIIIDIVVTALLILLCCYFVAPVLWLVLATTKTQDDVFGTSPIWFGSSFRLFDNLSHVLNYDNGIFFTWTRNSLLYTIPSVAATLLTSAAAGYGLAKYRFHGRTFLLFVVVIALLVPSTALAVPIYLEGTKLGITNTPWGVILPLSSSAFGVWICYNFFAFQFSTEIIHSARMDGANEYVIFGVIGLPSARGVLGVVGMLSFVGNWNNFFLPFLMEAQDNTMPLPVGLGNMARETSLGSQASSFAGSNISIMDVITGAFLVAIPVVIVFMVVRRYWATGLATGSVSGQ
jgi:multiple sugar transport system permease protein